MGLETVAEIEGEGKLADYYLAALEYIDPALAPDSSLAEVMAAAERRRDGLAQASPAEIHEELGALSEALQFVQRVRRTREIPQVNPAAPSDTAANIGPEGGLESPAVQHTEANTETGIADSTSHETDNESEFSQQGLFDFDNQVPPKTAELNQPAKPPESTAAEVEPASDEPGPNPDVKLATPASAASLPDSGSVMPAIAAGKDTPSAKPGVSAAPKPDPTAPLQLPKAETHTAPPVGQLAKAEAKSSVEAVKKVTKPAGPPKAEPPRHSYLSQRKRNGQTLREVMAQAQHEAAGLPAADNQLVQEAVAARNTSNRTRFSQLPEARAWPIVLGLALISWQVWLAAYAGWTVTRFFAWPAPDYGYLVSPSQTVLLIAIAVIIALVVAKLAWSYRRQTQRLLLLAHLSAVLIGMDLLAWWLAALDPDKLIPAPSFWYWAALVIGWLATAFACWLHDLRAGRHSPE